MRQEVRTRWSRVARLVAVWWLVGASGPLRLPTPSYGAPFAQTPPAPTDSSPQQQAQALRQEGDTLLGQRDPGSALDRFQQALVLYRQAGDRAGERLALNQIGIAHYRAWTSSRRPAKRIDKRC